MLYSDCRFQIMVVVQLWSVDHDNSVKDRDALNKFPFQSRKFKNVINKKMPLSKSEQLESCGCQEDVDPSDALFAQRIEQRRDVTSSLHGSPDKFLVQDFDTFYTCQ